MEPQASYELAYTVAEQDLADKVGIGEEDVFPSVLATSRVVGLMEVSCARLMTPELSEGMLSVGVAMEINHLAPTPVHEEIRCRAVFERMEKKLYIFTVEVFDKGGKVASGTHTRAAVSGEKITNIARQRMELAP